MIQLLLTLTFFTSFIGIYYIAKYFRLRKHRKIVLDKFNVDADETRRSIFLALGDSFDQSTIAKDLSIKLIQADIKLKPSEFAILIVSLFLGLWFIDHRMLHLMLPLDCLAAFLAIFFSSRYFLSSRKSRRSDKLINQLPEICRMMSNSVKAGLTIQQGISLCAQDLREPARSEFIQMQRELAIGEDLNSVLSRFQERASSSDINIFVGTLLIQKSAGGNLGQILDMMAGTFESRIRVFKEIRASTAESKSIAYILPFMPIIMCIFVSLVIPGFLNPLFTFFGILLVVIVGILLFAALLIIKRLTRIKV